MKKKTLRQLYDEMDVLSRRFSRRSLNKMEMVVFENEILDGLVSADYNNVSGLLLLAETRMVFVCREKNKQPLVFQFYYSEIQDFVLEKGFLTSQIIIISPYQELVLSNIDKRIATEMRDQVFAKMKALTSTQFSAKKKEVKKKNVGAACEVRLLSDIFDREKGWALDARKCAINSLFDVEGRYYELVVNKTRIRVSEHSETVAMGNGHVQNAILLRYKFNNVRLLNVENLLKLNVLENKAWYFGLTENNQIILSIAVPTYHGLELNTARKLLLTAIVTLAQEIKKFQHDVAVQDAMNNDPHEGSISTESETADWDDWMDLIGDALDLTLEFKEQD